MLGTNGGGFFNANSAHPFENPNALTNFVQLVLIFSLGAGLTNVLGRMVKNEKQGWAIFAAMGILFLVGVTTAYWAEAKGNPQFAQFNVDQAPPPCSPAATWKARRCASASPTARSSPP